MMLERWFKRPTSTPPSMLITLTNAAQLRINAFLDHAKYELLDNDQSPKAKEKIEFNLSMIPERMPPSEDEKKLQQKIAALKLSRDLELSSKFCEVTRFSITNSWM